VSCVQGVGQNNPGTALQEGEYWALELKYNRPKTRTNLRTTGFNLVCKRGKRSFHSTSSVKEGKQSYPLELKIRRSFSTKVRLINLDERALTAELTSLVKDCKNKDGRYGNLTQIIASFSVLKLAYSIIKRNKGISSKGVDDETLDGISEKDLQKMSKDIMSGKFKFSPVRRVLIPKPGKTELRPLGISSPRQKIVQKAIEMVLSTIFEEEFLDCSHGFRPGRNCHSALKRLQLCGNVSTYTWAIEGDIKGCFDNIPHKMIIKGLKQKIDCPPTLNLTNRILNAGYILNEDLKKVGKKNAKVYKSNIGIPQGTVLSPLFSNIVLHQLDLFVEKELKKSFEIGKKRKENLEYRRLRYRIKLERDLKIRRKLIQKCKKLPSKQFDDDGFKRIYYVRYADDWVLLVAGSYKDALNIREKVSNKLKKLGLTLNLKKTQITSLRVGRCRFVGVDFFIRKSTDEHFKPIRARKIGNTTVKQRFAPRLILQAPILELLVKLKENGFVKRNNKGEFFPKGKANCIPLTHPQILNFFNSKIRGTLNYFSCVHNRNQLWSVVRFFTYSCALTLARKHKLKTVKKAFKKFGKRLKYTNEDGRKFTIYRPDNLKMLAIDKRFKTNSKNIDVDTLLRQSWANSMTLSQFDEPCAVCGTTENIEIHHLRPVKDLRMKLRPYAQWAGGYKRMSVPLCRGHHLKYHAGTLSSDDYKKIVEYKGKMSFKAAKRKSKK
jgi:group II intron reverse transcriptase/maturase